MTSSRSFRTILLALTAGALGAIGCVITVGEVDCSECSANVDPDPLCHSEFNAATDSCECDPGYVFESNDANDFECEREGPKPGTGDCGTDPNTTVNAAGDCECQVGFVWCSDDPDDLTCCGSADTDETTVAGTSTADPTGGSESGIAETGTGTDGDTDPVADTGSGGDTGPAELPPCDASLDMMSACTNNGGIDNVENGTQYMCLDGEWNLFDAETDCTALGTGDFSYGCYINESGEVTNFCGFGPGTDCTDDDDACATETLLQSCLFGKLTDVDCETFCTGKKAEIQTDFGECDPDTFTCCCFDDGDEGNCQ